MSETTKGPWRVCGNTTITNSGQKIPVFEVCGTGDACWVAMVQNHRSCIGTPQGDANARLIAAAPLMYELIEKRSMLGDNECTYLLETIKHGT